VSIANCILEFPQTHINARFLSHIDNFGSPPPAMIHLEIFHPGTRENQAIMAYLKLKDGDQWR
jgi:hypothetical protein